MNHYQPNNSSPLDQVRKIWGTGAQVWSAVGEAWSAALSSVGPMLPRQQGACEIPPPCWVPQSHGEVVCTVGPKADANLRIHVVNNHRETTTFRVSGSPPQGFVAHPPTFTLKPFERVHILITLDSANLGDEPTELTVWVQGCRQHYFYWTIRRSCIALPTCPSVEIVDGPDLVHHWYDHFYCARPCRARETIKESR